MGRTKPLGSPGRGPTEDHDGLFRWVTDFGPRVGGGVPGDAVPSDAVAQRGTASRSTADSEATVVRLVGLSGLLVTVAAALAALLVPFREDGDPTDTGGPIVLDAPSPSPSAPAEAPIVSTVLPSDCFGLYGQAMLGEFERESMQLNQVWTGAREETAGSGDAELVAMLAGRPSLDCFWLDATGGSESAVLTVATEISAEESAAVEARLVALGFAHQRDRGGIRYFVESRVDGQSRGESHFLRDGVWLATNWYGFGPWGYTRHMAENVFT